MTVTITLFQQRITMNTMRNEKPINLTLFVSLGAIFWFEGVLFIRFLGGHLFVEGNPWLLGWFVASIPLSWVLVKIGATIGQVEGEKLLAATALMTLAAVLLDGIGLTWFQSWYGLVEPGQLLLAAAWLLWGAGLGLAIGYRESQA
jgi:hypothetical protein